MSIVRSLLIKVGFVTDKQTINQTNKAIAGFKTRFAIAASAATYAFSKIANYFTDVAYAALDAEKLARSLGVSFVEFTKLQKAFQAFGVDDKQFNAFFEGLNQNLFNFRYKLDGELVKLAQAFNFKPDEIKDVTEIFDAVINKLSTIQNFAQRKDFAEAFFKGMGERLATIAGRLDEFKSKVDESDTAAKNLEKSLPAFEKYREAVNGLSEAWQNFVIVTSEYVIPALTKLIDYLKPALQILTAVTGIYSSLFKGDKQGIIDNAKSASKALDPAFEGVNSAYQGTKNVVGEFLSDIFSPWWQRFNDYVENRDYGMTPATAMGAPIVTNNIDIQVGPGTTEQQAQFMSDRIEQQVEESIMSTFQRIQNNNPMVE